MSSPEDQESLGRQKHRRPYRAIILWAVVFVVIGAASLFWVPGLLLKEWLPNGTVDERGKLLGSAAQIVLFGLGGVIAVVGVGLSLSRHRQELEAAERDRQRHIDDRAKEQARRDEFKSQRDADAEREMRSRFVTAVDLLSADQSIKRTAALYSIAALADDWHTYGRQDEVQVCINVLCGYLRAPLPQGAESTPAEEIEVKMTGYNLIRQHLNPKNVHSWSSRAINLSGAHIDFNANLAGATLAGGGYLSLLHATLAGGRTLSLFGVKLAEGAHLSLDHARLAEGAHLSLKHVKLSAGATVRLAGVKLAEGARLSLTGATLAEDATVTLAGATLAKGAHATLDAKLSAGAYVMLDRATLADGAHVSLNGAKMSAGALVSLADVTLADGAHVLLDGAKLDGPVLLPSPFVVTQRPHAPEEHDIGRGRAGRDGTV